MVVRNPKRFKNCYTGLNIIAYIVTNEIIAKQRRDNIFRKQSEHEPTSYETVRIDLLNGVKVYSEYDLRLEKKVCLITTKGIYIKLKL